MAIQRDQSVYKYKPDTKVRYSENKRIEMVNALKVVDEVVFIQM